MGWLLVFARRHSREEMAGRRALLNGNERADRQARRLKPKAPVGLQTRDPFEDPRSIVPIASAEGCAHLINQLLAELDLFLCAHYDVPTYCKRCSTSAQGFDVTVV